MRRRPKILACHDFSPPARAALHEAMRLAHLARAELVILHVFPARLLPGEIAWEGAAAQRHHEEAVLVGALDAAASDARSLGALARVRFGHGDAAREILHAEREEDPDLLVLGAHEPTGLSRFVLGSVATAVCRDARGRVLVVRRAPSSSPTDRLENRRIVVGVDFSTESAEAVAAAAHLAELAGGNVELVHVLPNGSGAGEARHVRDRLERMAHDLAEGGIPATPVVRSGDPARVLLAETEKDPSTAIVVGTRRRSATARRFFGSVAEGVLRGTAGMVLVTHAREETLHEGRAHEATARSESPYGSLGNVKGTNA